MTDKWTSRAQEDVEAWLGEEHDFTDDQVERLQVIARRHAGELNRHDRDVALSIAYRALTGDQTVIDELATDLADAQEAAWRATSGLRLAALLMVTPEGPISDIAYARRAGVNQRTVRNWLEK